MINRLKLFILGWKRQSALMLNKAGCPMWLIDYRCPKSPVWPKWLGEFVELLPKYDETADFNDEEE